MRQNQRNKYGNKRTVINGKKFASKKEGERYKALALLQSAGHISLLQTQVPFILEINGVKVCKYIADFVYYDKQGRRIVEDTKGFRTPEYKLKAKLMRAIHGIEILES